MIKYFNEKMGSHENEINRLKQEIIVFQMIKEKTYFNLNYEYEKMKECIEMINDFPGDFRNADYRNIKKEILDFYDNDKIFCWLTGKVGAGKTYSLYALKIYLKEKNIDFQIIKEYDFNYEFLDKLKKEEILAIDDFGISTNENRCKVLLENYFELIDYARENKIKIVITSNYTPDSWLKKMQQYNNDLSTRIASRFSKEIDIIDLGDKDRRKV